MNLDPQLQRPEQLSLGQKRFLELKDNEIRETMASLQQVARADTPKIREEIFRDVFLPFFAGDQGLDARINLGLWVQQIGNPYREAEIIDNQDRVLFTVPAIMNRHVAQPVVPERSSESFYEITETSKKLSVNSPNQAFAYLTAMIAKKDMFGFDVHEARAEAKRWNDIFTRYGRPVPFQLDETVASLEEGSASKNMQDDIVDFE